MGFVHGEQNTRGEWYHHTISSPSASCFFWFLVTRFFISQRSLSTRCIETTTYFQSQYAEIRVARKEPFAFSFRDTKRYLPCLHQRNLECQRTSARSLNSFTSFPGLCLESSQLGVKGAALRISIEHTSAVYMVAKRQWIPTSFFAQRHKEEHSIISFSLV